MPDENYDLNDVAKFISFAWSIEEKRAENHRTIDGVLELSRELSQVVSRYPRDQVKIDELTGRIKILLDKEVAECDVIERHMTQALDHIERINSHGLAVDDFAR